VCRIPIAGRSPVTDISLIGADGSTAVRSEIGGKILIVGRSSTADRNPRAVTSLTQVGVHHRWEFLHRWKFNPDGSQHRLEFKTDRSSVQVGVQPR
jgi:hypothetical protein